jgi:hypothetical protein
MVSVSIPLDDDGFLRRECPNCEREFKWHHGPTDARPEDFVEELHHYCPLCGQSNDPERFWTPAQVEYMQGMVMPEAVAAIDESMKGLEFKSDFISVSVSTPEVPEPPNALDEPNDMVIVSPPCHPWEPVKIPEGWADSVHCLLCGAPFALE